MKKSGKKKRVRRTLDMRLAEEGRRRPGFHVRHELGVLAKLLTMALNIARQRQGINQKTIARRLGVSQAAVSQLFSGDRNLTLETIERMALAIGKMVRFEIVELDPKEM